MGEERDNEVAVFGVVVIAAIAGVVVVIVAVIGVVVIVAIAGVVVVIIAAIGVVVIVAVAVTGVVIIITAVVVVNINAVVIVAVTDVVGIVAVIGGVVIVDVIVVPVTSLHSQEGQRGASQNVPELVLIHDGFAVGLGVGEVELGLELVRLAHLAEVFSELPPADLSDAEGDGGHEAREGPVLVAVEEEQRVVVVGQRVGKPVVPLHGVAAAEEQVKVWRKKNRNNNT